MERKEDKDPANPRIFSRFFVFYAFLVVRYVPSLRLPVVSAATPAQAVFGFAGSGL
jgi:hypothetical protein